MKKFLPASKINLVHVLPSLKTGGAEVFVVNLLKSFNKSKFRCILLTLFTPEKNNNLLKQIYETDITHFSLGKRGGFSLNTIRKLRSYVKDISPDIIHTHLYCMKYVFLSHIGSSTPPWVHTVHNIASKELSYQDRTIARLIYGNKKARAIAVSESVKESFHTCYRNSQATVIHNGIPLTKQLKKTKSHYRKDLHLPEDGKIIVFAARFVHQKNHSMLISAFKRVKKEYPACYLVLLGDGPLRITVETQVKKEKLTDCVIFTGRVNNPISYFHAADIFALPSHHEGLPISLLEAMAAGLPVVATKAGGVPEVVDHTVNGYLVNIGDLNGFTAALLELVRTKMQAEFGKKARERVSRDFNIQVTAEKYEKIYSELLS